MRAPHRWIFTLAFVASLASLAAAQTRASYADADDDAYAPTHLAMNLNTP